MIFSTQQVWKITSYFVGFLYYIEIKPGKSRYSTVPKKWNGLRAAKWPRMTNIPGLCQQVHRLGGQTWPSIRPLNTIKVVNTQFLFQKINDQLVIFQNQHLAMVNNKGKNGFPSFILPQTQRPHRLHDLWGSGYNLVFVGSVALTRQEFCGKTWRNQ